MKDRPEFDVQKELDQVIGHFEDRRGTRWQRFGRIATRVLVGASLAVATATLVVYTLDVHVRQAKTEAAANAAKAPGKPVQVQIIPPK